jgi:hypothetical protein
MQYLSGTMLPQKAGKNIAASQLSGSQPHPINTKLALGQLLL